LVARRLPTVVGAVTARQAAHALGAGHSLSPVDTMHRTTGSRKVDSTPSIVNARSS
jgi:hypothetical protein